MWTNKIGSEAKNNYLQKTKNTQKGSDIWTGETQKGKERDAKAD